MSVFWDKQIPPGKTYDQFIKEQLDHSRCIVVLWSAASVISDWVKEEASRGIAQAKLVPVLIEQIEPPLGFGRIEAAELYHWAKSTGDGSQQDQAELANLLQAITTMLTPSVMTDPAMASAAGQVREGDTARSWQQARAMASTPIPFKQKTPYRMGKAIGVGALVTIATLAAINLSKPKQESPPSDTQVQPKTPDQVPIPSATQETAQQSSPAQTTASTATPTTAPPPPPPTHTSPPNPPPANKSATTGTVYGNAGDKKNLRSGPGTKYGIVKEIATGETVEVLGSSSDEGGYMWSRVRTSDGTEAWIASHLLTIP